MRADWVENRPASSSGTGCRQSATWVNKKEDSYINGRHSDEYFKVSKCLQVNLITNWRFYRSSCSFERWAESELEWPSQSLIYPICGRYRVLREGSKYIVWGHVGGAICKIFPEKGRIFFVRLTLGESTLYEPDFSEKSGFFFVRLTSTGLTLGGLTLDEPDFWKNMFSLSDWPRQGWPWVGWPWMNLISGKTYFLCPIDLSWVGLGWVDLEWTRLSEKSEFSLFDWPRLGGLGWIDLGGPDLAVVGIVSVWQSHGLTCSW